MSKCKLIVLASFSLLGQLLNAQTLPFNSRGVGGGGALFAPSINPADATEFYISCDMSELFHTTNGGADFSQVHFGQFIGGHHSKVCFTNTPGLLYSISYINDIGTPVKSNDNGLTWTVLTGNPDDAEDTYSLYVDYSNPDRVVLSYYGEIYFSSNGGTSFSLIHTASSGAGNLIGGAFFDGSNIYLGTNDGVLVSTNAGLTWSIATITGLPAGEVIYSFAAARTGTTTRFFCLTADDADVYVGIVGSDYWDFMNGVYSCDYGSTNWVNKTSNLVVGVDFPMYVGMAENDINVVYLGGSSNAGEPAVYKTSNAGSSWSNTFITTNNQNVITGWSGDGGDRGWGYGECVFGMCVSPANSNNVLIGDFGFPHFTTNGGTNWQQAYVSTTDQHPANTSTPPYQYYHSVGIENTTSWQVHFTDATNVWGCFSDIRGIRSEDGGDTWSFDYTGYNANSSYRVAQDASGTLYMASSNIHDMYQSTRLQDAILDGTDANGKIMYSTDKGQTWNLLHNFNHPVFWIEIDPSNPNRAYASVIHYNGGSGIGGVYRCDDLNNLATSTWTLLPDPPRTEKHPACLKVLNDGTLVATYSGRRNSAGAFTASSGVFTYHPSSGSWTDVSDAGMYYWTKDLVIDPNDAAQNTWYVGVFSGWGGPPNGLGGLYKTTNRGVSWTKLTGTTLDRVTSCTFNPSNNNQIYLTTEGQGLWQSSDINATVPSFSQVEDYSFRQPERVFFNPFNTSEMWVTSFGNGLKVADLTVTQISELDDEELFRVYPNPSEGWVNLTTIEPGIVNVYTLQGQLLGSYAVQAGSNRLDLTNFPNGIYFLKLRNVSQKIILNR